MNPRFVAALAVLSFTTSPSLQAADQPVITLQVTETSLGKWDPGGMKGTLAVSPDGRHIAYAAKRGNKFVVIRDGKDGKLYEGYGSDGDFAGKMQPLFSQNSQKLGYSARQGDQWTFVVDGHEGSFYDEISGFDLALSADGKVQAFAARQKDAERVIVNGIEGPAYSWIREGPILSSDGKHLAYVAERSTLEFGQPATYFVVLDGKEGPGYIGPGIGHEGDEIVKDLTFSPDGRHLAYLVKRDKKWLCVVDGVEGKAYDNFSELFLVFSADGQKLAYSAHVGDKWQMVLNGHEGPLVEGRDLLGLGPIEFSPDGNHIAYSSVHGKNDLCGD